MRKKAILIIISALLLFSMLFLPGCMEEDPGYSIVVDEDGNVITFDANTGAIVTIEFPHHQIHDGKHFQYSEVVELPINNVLDIQITTTNTTEWAHMTAEFDVESETEWWVYENVTINVAGAAVNEYNTNRNSANGATIVLATITNANIANANADTAIAGATFLFHGKAGAGKKVGGQGSSRQELVLLQNEDYTLRFSATGAGYVSFLIRWYEHTNN